jgi:hypothetical protein
MSVCTMTNINCKHGVPHSVNCDWCATELDASPIIRQIQMLEKRLKEVEEILNNVTKKVGYRPHKCPICDGNGGTVICGVVNEYCKTCKGKGIVWG